MNIFKKKFLVKLIASICVCLSLLNCGVINNKVYAEEAVEVDEEIWGGILIQPIIEVVMTIADGALDLLQNALLSSGQVQINSLIKLEGEIDPVAETVLAIMVIFAFLIVAVAIIAVGGFAGVIAAGLTKVAIGAAFVVKLVTVAVVAGVITGVCVAKKYSGEWFPKDLYLPLYKVTPQEIFSNELSIFDVNFFNPMPNTITKVTKTIEKIEDIHAESYTYSAEDDKNGKRPAWAKANSGDTAALLTMLSDGLRLKNPETNEYFGSYNELENFDWNAYKESLGSLRFSDHSGSGALQYIINIINQKKYRDIRINDDSYTFTGKTYLERDIDIPNGKNVQINHTHIRIFYNGEPKYIVKYQYDMNTNNAKISIHEIIESEDVLVDVEMVSTAKQLRDVIAQWYFALRNLALLILMIILIYSGIRIVIGSTAGEKAKHKERLMDWLIALCLVMLMHYIMVFAIEAVEKITELVKEATGQDAYVNMIEITKGINEAVQKYNKDGIELAKLIEPDPETEYGWLAWPTDLMGQMRVEAQTVNEGTARWAGYSIAFVVLVCFTIFFTWTYIKRVVYMAFLTMIAPLVAMTYPIDKMTDGKAQAFNAWLKEYIFNLLIQPMHLLLYTMLVTSAFELASKNALYTIVAVGFMMPAEKLLRKLFGFEKAQTPGLLGGAAGAALAMTGMQSLISHRPKENGKEKDAKEDKNDIRFSSANGVSAINTATQNIDFSTGTQTGASNINIITTQKPKKEGETRSTLIVNTANQNGNGIQQINQAVRKTPQEIQISVDNKPQNKKKGTKSKKTKKRRILRTTGAIIGSYGRGQANKVWKRMRNGHPIRSLAKGALGLTGAATLGTIGLALGIASGDASKALKYTTASAVGGYALGKGVAGSVANALTVDGEAIKDDAELVWYGDDYKNAKLQQQKDDFIKNENNINYMRMILGTTRKDAKEILEKEGSICLNSGISNVEDVAAIHNMVKEQEYNIEDAIAMKKFSDRLPNDINKMPESKIEGYREQFQTEMEDKLRAEVKEDLIDQIKTKHEEEIQADIIQQLRENNENIDSEEARQKIEQLTNERIEEYAEQKISEQARAKSEDIMLGVLDFANAKSALKEA